MSFQITVVVPTHRRSQKLELCLMSISKQALAEKINLQLLIVDNSTSPNDSLEIQNLIHSFCAAQVFRTTTGVNAARNKGLKNAEANIVLFIDDDCVLLGPGFIQKHIDFHQNNSLAFAAGGQYLVGSNANYIEREYVLAQRAWLCRGQVSGSQEVRFLLGGNLSIKKEVASKNNIFFDEKIVYGGSETEFFVQALRLGLMSFRIEADLSHDCKMNFAEYCRKAFRQGRGKAYREKKWGREVCNKLYIQKTFENQKNGSIQISKWVLKSAQSYFFKKGYSEGWKQKD